MPYITVEITANYLSAVARGEAMSFDKPPSTLLQFTYANNDQFLQNPLAAQAFELQSTNRKSENDEPPYVGTSIEDYVSSIASDFAEDVLEAGFFKYDNLLFSIWMSPYSIYSYAIDWTWSTIKNYWTALYGWFTGGTTASKDFLSANEAYATLLANYGLAYDDVTIDHGTDMQYSWTSWLWMNPLGTAALATYAYHSGVINYFTTDDFESTLISTHPLAVASYWNQLTWDIDNLTADYYYMAVPIIPYYIITHAADAGSGLPNMFSIMPLNPAKTGSENEDLTCSGDYSLSYPFVNIGFTNDDYSDTGDGAKALKRYRPRLCCMRFDQKLEVGTSVDEDLSYDWNTDDWKLVLSSLKGNTNQISATTGGSDSCRNLLKKWVSRTASSLTESHPEYLPSYSNESIVNDYYSTVASTNRTIYSPTALQNNVIQAALEYGLSLIGTYPTSSYNGATSNSSVEPFYNPPYESTPDCVRRASYRLPWASCSVSVQSDGSLKIYGFNYINVTTLNMFTALCSRQSLCAAGPDVTYNALGFGENTISFPACPMLIDTLSPEEEASSNVYAECSPVASVGNRADGFMLDGINLVGKQCPLYFSTDSATSDPNNVGVLLGWQGMDTSLVKPSTHTPILTTTTSAWDRVLTPTVVLGKQHDSASLVTASCMNEDGSYVISELAV